MAIDITINLTDEREAELVKITSEANTSRPSTDQLSPSQFLRQFVREWLDLSAQQRKDRNRLALREAYARATADVQLQVRTLLGFVES